MARDENLPFDLGQTYFGGDTATIDANVGGHLEGKEFYVEDYDYSTGTIGAQAARSNRLRRVRVVRNMNATALLPKQIAKQKMNGATPGVICGQVDGVTASYTEKGWPVDEALGTAGCKQYDLCYVVVEGLAKVTTDATGDTTISIGGNVVPGAGGKVIELDPTLTAANLIAAINNTIGIAAGAVAAINTDFVVLVGGHRRG